MRVLLLYWYEARRVGRAALLAPALLVAAVAGGAALAAGSASGAALARPLQFAVEMGLPLAAGIGTAAVLARDPAIELQLSLPTGYRATVLRRCAAIVAAGSLVAVAVCGGLAVSGWWGRLPRTHGALLGELTWAAPMWLLVGLGLLAAVALRSAAAAATVVAAPWLIGLLLPDQMAAHAWSRVFFLFATSYGGGGSWTANRLGLLAAGSPPAAAAWLLLGRTERLLDGEPE